MHKFISNLLLFALFVSASAFTASQTATTRSEGATTVATPDFILTLAAAQVAPGTAKIIWSSSNDGPYTVEVVDAGTNQQVYFNNAIYDNDVAIPGLQPGKYNVMVNDNDNMLEESFLIQ